MARTALILVVYCLLSGPGLFSAERRGPNFPPARPPSHEISIENRVAVPMRDGVTLYADVYRPSKPGQYPVIVSRTPYSVERAPSAYTAAVFFARRGYAFVFQDVRGRHESEGKWDAYRDNIDDGYDTIEWAAAQPWSNGKVGMQGGSYLGHVQWHAAKAVPPHLTTIFPNVAATSMYHDSVTVNGGWRLAKNLGWGAVRQESRIMQNTGQHTMEGGPERISYDYALWHLPFLKIQNVLGRDAFFYKNWIDHPNYDDYWKELSVEEHYEKINVPVHTFGGWYDILVQGTINGYIGMSTRAKTAAAREGSRMIVGAWGHGPSRKHGDLDFGEYANVNLSSVELRWFDHWLRGIDTGMTKDPPVTVFVMGRNEWRQETAYPLPQTKYTKLYVDSSGRANSYRGDGKLRWDPPGADSATDSYRYDPQSPVPSHGGANCCGAPTPEGPRDQRIIEQRNDVLVYTSDFLEEPVEIVGPVKVVLYASSDAPDTDFVAKLVDVHPDGKAYNLCEGLLPARFREGLAEPKYLESGKVYEFTINLIGTANVFQPGHRIRLDITSSHFPQFARSLNTAEEFGKGESMRVARQTIHHSGVRPSHVLLPVIPKGM